MMDVEWLLLVREETVTSSWLVKHKLKLGEGSNVPHLTYINVRTITNDESFAPMSPCVDSIVAS